jgi:hypothetical protein
MNEFTPQYLFHFYTKDIDNQCYRIVQLAIVQFYNYFTPSHFHKYQPPKSYNPTILKKEKPPYLSPHCIAKY